MYAFQMTFNHHFKIILKIFCFVIHFTFFIYEVTKFLLYKNVKIIFYDKFKMLIFNTFILKIQKLGII